MAKRAAKPDDKPDPIAVPPPSTPPQASDLLTTRELMDYLKVSRTKVWQLVTKQGLPAFKLGGDYRYRRSEVDAWMEGMRNLPGDEDLPS